MSLDNVKNIVLVLSGKGGVGKSSVTVQIALSLCLQGKSVGILDVDLTGPSIPRLLSLEDGKIKQIYGGWKPVEVHGAQVLPARSSSRDYEFDTVTGEQRSVGPLSAASLAFLLPSRSSAVIWRGPKKTAMVRQFLTDVLWPENLDYLIIDTPPGTSDEHISLAETLQKQAIESTPSSSDTRPKLAGAVVVTTPQAVATSDVKKELNFCKKVGINVLGVVENMSGFVCECCGEETNLFGKGGGQVMAEEFGVEFLGRVPLDQGWGTVVEEGGWATYQKSEDGPDTTNGKDEQARHGIQQDFKSPALLIERYQSCKSCRIFQDITQRMVDMIDSRHT